MCIYDIYSRHGFIAAKKFNKFSFIKTKNFKRVSWIGLLGVHKKIAIFDMLPVSNKKKSIYIHV